MLLDSRVSSINTCKLTPSEWYDELVYDEEFHDLQCRMLFQTNVFNSYILSEIKTTVSIISVFQESSCGVMHCSES